MVSISICFPIFIEPIELNSVPSMTGFYLCNGSFPYAFFVTDKWGSKGLLSNEPDDVGGDILVGLLLPCSAS